MLRIALPLIPSRGWQGGYNYLQHLIDALRSLSPLEVEPVVCRYRDSHPDDIAGLARPGLQFLDLPSDFRQRRLVTAPLRLALGLWDRGLARALQAHHVDVLLEVADFHGVRFPVPILAWFPDFQHRHLRQYFRSWQYWQREIGFRAQASGRRSILVSSLDAASDCRRLYPQAADRIRVVRFAVPFRGLPAEEEVRAVCDQYGLGPGFFFLPNQYWLHKNHEVVLRATAELRRRGMQVQIATCGNPIDNKSPGHYARLRKMAQDLQVTDQFLFLGRLPTDHVRCLLVGCCALINPSFFEGWSTTVEEAKTHGVPVILSDIPVHREQAPEQGRFFTPTDASQLADELTWALAEPGPHASRPSVQQLEADSRRRQVKFAQDFVRAVQETVRAANHP